MFLKKLSPKSFDWTPGEGAAPGEGVTPAGEGSADAEGRTTVTGEGEAVRAGRGTGVVRAGLATACTVGAEFDPSNPIVSIQEVVMVPA